MTEQTLTAEQRRVVEAGLDGPHLVNAGAGTGKTFTLVERTVDLVRRRGIDPSSLLLITFTNAAAAEITTRIDAAFGAQHPGRPASGTFHGIAAGLLREFSYQIGISPDVRVIDDGRARALFRRVFEELRQGRLDVDVSAFPLLERHEVLEYDLAGLALRFKHIDLGADAFEQAALARAGELEQIGFGAVAELTLKGSPRAGWPRPNPERTAEERRDEAGRERQNVRVMAALLRRFDELLNAEALLTFGDVLVRATRSIEADASIRTALQTRWQHAIVDEFQDTNSTQIAFLKAIFGTELRPVLAVGDLRQAIYAFTGADPSGIVKFGELPGCSTYPLTENRRSVQPILDVAHHTLVGRGGIPSALHQELTAQRGDAEPLTVRFELFDGDDSLEDESAAIAATIRGLVDGGVSPRQCAILLRARTHADAYARALWERGLAVQLDSGVGFFDAPEVREVLAWLRLVEQPGDRLAIVGALQSAAIGLGDGVVGHLAAGGTLARAALIDPIPDDFDAAERERLERFRAIARVVCDLADVPLVDALRTIVAASGADLARLDDLGRFDQVRANLEKLVRLAAELAHDRPLARVRDLVAEIAIRDELELDLPPAELEGERILISTIHRAKGREWRYVFVADCSPYTFPSPGRGRDTVALYDETRGVFALKHATDGRPTLRWYLAKHPHDERGVVQGKTTPSNNDEEFRLLYVALTRARDALYVSGRRVNNRQSEFVNIIRGWLEDRGYEAEAHRFPLPAEPVAPVATDELDTEVLQRALLARLTRIEGVEAIQPERRGALSYSAMELHEHCPRRARYHYVLGLPDLSDSAPAPSSADGELRELRDPARFGRIVHKVLEYDMRARIDETERDLARFVADAVDEEEGTAEEAHAAHRAAEAARPILARYVPIDAERRFGVTIDGVNLVGYIDLLARDEDGRLVVVDYKTGRAEGEHYALQFGLYSWAVAEELHEASRIVLLRIAGDDVTEERVQPASEDVLHAAVAAARTMESDEPRPGPGCRYCPYAHDVCLAAPTFLESA